MPDVDLPDPLAPGEHGEATGAALPGGSPPTAAVSAGTAAVRGPHRPAGMPDLPKGDLRVASVIAVVTSAAVLAWHAVVAAFATTVILDDDGVSLVVLTQVLTWLVALVSFGCGLLSLNARRSRPLAAAGFIAGCAALVVSVSFAVIGELPRFS